LFTGFRLRIRQFFRRNKKVITFVLILWLVVIMVNEFLKTNTFEEFQRNSYNEHEAVLSMGDKVPESLKQPINETIDRYFNYCNNKQYSEAYQMVSEECKEIYFPTLDEFKKYIDMVFTENKIYYLQNYSNYNDKYIYRMRIMEDLMATGLTGEKFLYFYEEKIVLEEKEDGTISLSLRQFVSNDLIEEVYEDDNMKIYIDDRDVFYEEEYYHIRVKNKTSNTIVLADTQEMKEVLLQVGSEKRSCNNDNLNLVIYPEETKDFTLSFTKFFDENEVANKLIFNTVRILSKYSGFSDLQDYEINNAEDLYSIEIPF